MKHDIKTVFSVSSAQDVPEKTGIQTVAHIGGHETIHQKNYEFTMDICFSVRGRNLNSKQVNPLLKKFREQLEAFKLYENGMKCWVVRVSEFEHEEMNMDYLLCSQQILLRAHDQRGFSLEAIKPKLLKNMRMQGSSNDEEQSITIQMVDALYMGSSKSCRWPNDPTTYGR